MLRKRQRRKTIVLLLLICMVLSVVPSCGFAGLEDEDASQETEAVTDSSAEDISEEVADEDEAPEPEKPAEDPAEIETDIDESESSTEPVIVEEKQPSETASEPAIKAISVGTKIKYTGKRVGKVDQTTIFTYKDTANNLTYTGTCRQAGIPMSKSGTGTIESKISNNSKIAKVIYRYAVQKGWLTGKNAATNARKVLGLNYKIGFTYRRLIESACQIHNMGAKDFKKAMMNVGGVSEPTVDAIINWYSNLDVSKVKVPDGFELYQVSTAKGVQPFTMWAVRNPPPPPTENGFAAVKKVSGDASLTYDGEPDEIEDDTEE